MPKQRALNPRSVWDSQALLEHFKENGIKESHAVRIWKHLVRHADAEWADVPELPRAAVELLQREYRRETSRVVREQKAASGDTTKLLVRLQDGYEVEAVIMSYDTSGRGGGDEDSTGSESSGGAGGRSRKTLCISSQVGCQMGCTFCATGTMGLKADLTCGEIIEQLVHARKGAGRDGIRNIVFMGMGEPLNNYPAVAEAVRLITDPRLFGLARRQVTVSTVGVAPRILQMASDLPGISLALSLHAPTQELRQQIVPSGKAYKLDRLMAAVRQYQGITKQRVFVEYVMLSGVNDSRECATKLGTLLDGMDVVVNLIPWNPVCSKDASAFDAPSESAVSLFQTILRQEFDISSTVRQEKGQDIAGACGQLVVQQALLSSPDAEVPTQVKDIEELGCSRAGR